MYLGATAIRIKKKTTCYLIPFILFLCCLILYYFNHSTIPRIDIVYTTLTRPIARNNDRRETQQRKKLNNQCYLPAKVDLVNLEHSKLAALYHGYISDLQVGCDRIIRLGEECDGGWDICDDSDFRPDKPCLVYSFGIDKDFSFDDAIAERYGCEVHSFDPSMKMKEGLRKPNVWFHPYGIGYRTEILRGKSWPLYILTDMKKQLKHQTRSITVLKLDVEEWEILAFPQMILDGSLKNIKQLIVEFHITMRPEPNKQRYINGLTILIDLYNLGFRIFWTKRNLHCRFTPLELDIERTGCHEVSFVNINFAKRDL